ncbi:MAG TPA: S8 family serine peptidase, partial [Candidatus Angelobacter sp.]|nr:S8 family serine peptidase [Candidatus Angelobacter sp.]
MKRPSNMFLQLASAMIMPELIRLPKSAKPAHLMWGYPLPLVRFATLCGRRWLLTVLLAGFAVVMGLPSPAFGLQNDPLFLPYQWYHLNKGQGDDTPGMDGTAGADARTSLAWKITMGSKQTIIAIVEPGGFDVGIPVLFGKSVPGHPDLVPNFWVNPGANTFGDFHGWNFENCTPEKITATGAPSCGSSLTSLTPGNHGTLVAGVIAAKGDNNQGIIGACPYCSIMLLTTGKSKTSGSPPATPVDMAISAALKYAQLHGAKIINVSHGVCDFRTEFKCFGVKTGDFPKTIDAIQDVTDKGVVVLFAATNSSEDVCSEPSTKSFASLPGVIAVSSSTNRDQRAGFGPVAQKNPGFWGNAYGNCISVMAPSWHQDPGTLGITTTSRPLKMDGFNPGVMGGKCQGTQIPEQDDPSYTNCFAGTSSATALTSGVVGLILTANPSLTPLQVKRLLQDTADKIEDSVGAYSPTTGFSSPPKNSPSQGVPTHAFGRINAVEAVGIAALAVGKIEKNVKPRADIFVRDNDLDWGNTSQPSSFLLEPTRGFIAPGDSPDIKVGTSQVPPTLATFDSFSEQLTLGKKQWVYVRVRNRSPITAESVRVKLYLAQFNTSLPELPLNFWNNFPNNPEPSKNSLWHLAGDTTINDLKYSGASVAGCPVRAYPSCPADPGTVDPNAKATDNAQIVSFEIDVPIAYPSWSNLSLLVI